MKFEVLTKRQCTKIKGRGDLPVVADVSEGLKASLLSLEKKRKFWGCAERFLPKC